MLLKEYIGKTAPFSINGEYKEVTYITRIDPLSGNVAKISEERARRNVGISVNLDIRPLEKCDFCTPYQSTPEKRVEHEGGAISVPNKYPWEKYDWITIYPPYGEHKLMLSDLYFDDLERMIESSYDLALICSQDEEVIHFMDFTNWGAFAGASQQHPHSQRKSITFTLDPRQEQELRYCRELAQRYGRNPFDLLLEEERQDGRRIIFDNQIIILAAFAPICPDEVLLFPREAIAHILQTNSRERKELIKPALGIFSALFFYRGVTNLNIAVHMAPFRERDRARGYFRWHMHIYPRRSRLPVDRAGAEIGFETNVVDTLPERSAELLRRWYIAGPQEELVPRQEDNTPNPKLLDELHRLMNRHPHP